MASSAPGETLERLRHDEADLERAIGEARREAAATIEAARRDAAALAAAARADAEREAERIRAEGAEAADRERDASRAALEAEVQDVERRAAASRPRAVARAIAVARGEGG